MDATFSHIKEFLECSVCLEELDETCKVLPCQHTFCKKCLENIIASKGSLQCPECRTDFGNQRLQSLPPNVLLIRILEGLKRKPNAKTSDGNASTSNNKGYPRLLKIPTQEVLRQPCARALYDFQGTEEGDLSFCKGDIISLSCKFDENWYEGINNGQRGAIPANFIEVLVPVPNFEDSSEKGPFAKALYDFDDKTEKDFITFKQGDLISIIKKVDSNWCEGILGNQYGIFPLNYVELNTAAKTLLASQPSSDEDEDDDDELNAVAVANVRGGSPKGDRSSSPWVKVEPPKRHTIHVDNPNQQANAQLRRSLEFSSNSSSPSRDRRASESTLLDEPSSVPISDITPASRNSSRNSPRHSPRNSPRNSQERLDTPGASSSSSNTQESRPARHTDAANDIYIAVYNYTPHKDDELALLQGEQYRVQERYRDGWFKGYHVRSGRKGVFPGNYVKHRRSCPPRLARSHSSTPTLRGLTPPSPTANNFPPTSKFQPCHMHSFSAPVTVPNNGVSLSRTQRPGSCRGRSGSEPTDPDTLNTNGSRSTGSPKTTVSSLRLLKMLKRKVPKRPAPVPPPYSALPAHPHQPVGHLRRHRPVPILPSEPPPPYTPTPLPDHTSPSRSQQYQKYRAIVAFPPQNENELELKIGDIVIVTKKRDDGWYRGKSQRTGEVGLFPSVFVEVFSSS